MDLTWSEGITKLLIGAFLYPSLYTWEEVSTVLASYNIFHGSPLIGGFLNRQEVLEEDSIPREIFISIMNGLMANTASLFHEWIFRNKDIIDKPLFSITLCKFDALCELICHAEVDPHEYPQSLPQPDQFASFEESSFGVKRALF